ncbi:MAG: hypothetical protein EPO21_05315 [Chloroflexota bacterium]|nr:MAG: hypothetical protein EPO21_05315 [Chloroflexota bacterium]
MRYQPFGEVIKGFPLQFDPMVALRRRGSDPSGFFGSRVSPSTYRRALDEVRALVQPAFCYAVQPVLGAEPDRLLIATGQSLRSPVVAELFASAPEVALLVYTIGPALETRVAELRQQGKHLMENLLDRLGTLALQEVGAVAYGRVEELAREKGVRASIPLNPGTTHWPSADQTVFEELCPLNAIGVSLTASFFLHPLKSISMAIALGPDVLTPDKGSSCDYCATRHLCGL